MRRFFNLALENRPDDYSIVIANQSHAREIVALRAQLAKESSYVNTGTERSETRNIQECSDPMGIYQIVLYKNKAVGLCIASYGKDKDGNARTHVGLIAVLNAHSGRGLARKMLEAVVAWSLEKGCRRVTLYVNADNPRALHLYDSLAFKETDKFTYYEMEKTL